MSTCAISPTPTRSRDAAVRRRPVQPGRATAPVTPRQVTARRSAGVPATALVDWPVAEQPVTLVPVRHVRSVRQARATGSVRLTRRGRLVVVVLALGLALAAMTAFGPGSAATSHPGAPVQTHVVEVGAGDTLWEIAAGVAAPGHVRDKVQQIEELNHLSGPAVTIGQEIAVPIG